MIVIFAREDDAHARAVAAILDATHREAAIVFDMARFPVATRLSVSFAEVGSSCILTDGQGRQVDLYAVTSFWWRRPQALQLDPRITDPSVQQFALNESFSALHGVLRSCPGLWVNDINRDEHADYKPRQLHLARQHGLQVPETLITNDPAKVRAFFDAWNGDVVYKAFNQRGLIWRPTRRLATADFAHIDSVACAPVIFQRHVEGVRDIRVTVVGPRVFGTEFRIEGAPCIDHRLLLDSAACAAHRLPAELEAQVLHYVRALGLEYGSLDFRLTADGAYWFFEINTAGEFLYLQERSGQPIAQAMAEHLALGEPACPAATLAAAQP